MKFIPTEIPEVIYIEPDIFRDNRGYFTELYHEAKFKEAGIHSSFVQDNQSKSSKYTIRGLHFQKPPMTQAKLVRAIQGEILDVAIDLRKDSPTFKQWVSRILSDENFGMLYIPEGFAHGFATLSDTAVISYKCSNVYSPECDSGIFWKDEELNINWPFDPSLAIISEKDKNQTKLNEFISPFN